MGIRTLDWKHCARCSRANCRQINDTIKFMDLFFLSLALLLAVLLVRTAYISRQRLRENQELRRVLAQLRVDRIIGDGDGYSYSGGYSGVTFIHQTPGRTDNLLV